MSRLTIHMGAFAGLFLLGSHLIQAQTTAVSVTGSASTTGIVGVTSTQTARLNVLNLQPVIPGVPL